jgi:hypothetical protein
MFVNTDMLHNPPSSGSTICDLSPLWLLVLVQLAWLAPTLVAGWIGGFVAALATACVIIVVACVATMVWMFIST